MDESEAPSWKGHSFTLFVFTGIVVLCSIFFVLGMLVGRSQGQRMAENAAAEDATRKTAAQPLAGAQPLNYFKDTTELEPDNTLQPRSAPPAHAEGSVPAQAPPPEPEPTPVKEPIAEKFYVQILATKNNNAAGREQAKVQSKGFQAIIFLPKPDDKEAWYRVQVGPYDTKPEAAIAMKELQAQGYKDVALK